jgi:hypothetical protein
VLARTEFQSLLASARRGEAIVYYTGYLLNDRKEGSQLEATADAAWAEHVAGRCLLVQKRIADGVYEYIAIKLDPPKPVRYLGCYDPDRLNYHKVQKVKIDNPKATRRSISAVADWLPSPPMLPGR